MPLTIRRSLVDLVRQWRKIIYSVCAGVTVLAGAAVFVSVSSPGTSIAVTPGEPFFDPSRAFRRTDDMWTFLSAPPTEAGEVNDIFTWFEDQLPGPNMARVESFDAPMGDETVSLRNFTVVLEGLTDETVVVAAARDTPGVVKVEPLNFTSGTGILLELIEVFAARSHQKTLVFLSTEDSSNGGLGIEHFLDTSPLADSVSVIVSIHGLGKVNVGTEQAHPVLVGITAARNTTPGWLLQLATATFAKSGVELVVPGLWRQAADRAMALGQGDQIAGLTKGIPSIRLYDDTPGNPNAQGLAAHGPALERLVLSLDAGAELPGDPGTALLLKSGRYLTNGAVTLLAVLCLFPMLAFLAIWLWSARIPFGALLRNLRNLLSFAVPIVLTLLMSLFLTLGGLIPQYRFQVPTEGAATQPSVGPILILLVVLVPSFILSRRFLGYFRSRESKPVTEMSKLATGFFGVFLGLMLLTARSPFLMLVSLSVAWAWPLVTCFTEPVYRSTLFRRRLGSNLPILLIGLFMPLFFYGYVASTRGVGWFSTGWFLLVQTMSGSYGLSGPVGLTFVVAGFAVLLGVRRMRILPIESLDVKDELSMLELAPPFSRRRRSRDRSRKRSGPPLSPWG
jgi:hypothetical protein